MRVRSAPPGIGIVAALKRQIDQRIGDRAHAGFGDQRQELRDIVIVHRMHRGQVRPCRAPAEAEPLRLAGESLDMARHRIVALVAMQVDHEPAPGGELAQRLTEAAPSAIVRSKCGMPPTTSTPRSSARSRFSAAFGERK